MGDRQGTSEPAAVTGLDGTTPAWLTDDAMARVAAAEQRPFDDAEYAARLTAVRRRMAQRGVDVLVVFRPSSIEYLCGYHTAETAPQPLVVTESATALYIPDLEIGRALASARVDHVYFCGYTDALQGLRQFLEHATVGLPRHSRVGVASTHASTPPVAVALLHERDVAVVDADHLVERVRLVLSAAEIRCMEQAAEVTRAGEQAAIAAAQQQGATDASVAAAIASALYGAADSASAWGPVVVTGERAGIPHSSWRQQPLASGPTFLEFAGTHRRYHAPVMRTLLRRPGPHDRRLADLATTTVAAVLDNAAPGVPCAQVAARAGAALGTLPDDVVFHQLFGYPVGLAHKPHWMDGEPFHITAANDEPLQEGMVFHIPASFRSFGHRGIGLSQTFVVERDGARALTHGPAEPIVLDEA